MLTDSELSIIDNTYFTILGYNSFCCTIRSCNTGHFWHIVVREYGRSRSFEIWHRHRSKGEYHLHGHARSFEKVLASIQEHDMFQLSGRRAPSKSSC